MQPCRRGYILHGLAYMFTLDVSVYQCSKCSRKVEPPPLAFGCFPSSPTHAHSIWWDLRLLHRYRKLGKEGLSTTGEIFFMHMVLSSSFDVAFLTHVFKHAAFLESISQEHDFWCGSSKVIKASFFQDAYSAGFLPMILGVNDLFSLTSPPDAQPQPSPHDAHYRWVGYQSPRSYSHISNA